MGWGSTPSLFLAGLAAHPWGPSARFIPASAVLARPGRCDLGKRHSGMLLPPTLSAPEVGVACPLDCPRHPHRRVRQTRGGSRHSRRVLPSDRPDTTRAAYAATKITVGRCRWWGLHKFGVPIKMISLSLSLSSCACSSNTCLPFPVLLSLHMALGSRWQRIQPYGAWFLQLCQVGVQIAVIFQ